MILDCNGKDLMKYDKKYVLVIDVKPFTLNNYEETLEDLMALNFIMKSEDPQFNYSNIMKQGGKVYYNISEDTYNKINKLKNIKGIYTYISDTVDGKKSPIVSDGFFPSVAIIDPELTYTMPPKVTA
ncbi:MAG: iron-containing alcohol dehydrogenase, partial [Clostridium sp.]|nr:iron-containing alcohol dehydrogenase [Clostridium sp.]